MSPVSVSGSEPPSPLDGARVLCFIPNMRAGGAERVLAGLMNWMSDAGVRVTLATLDDSASFFALRPAIERRSVGSGARVRLPALPATCLRIRRAITAVKPDFVLSFLDVMNVPVLLASAGLRVPVVVSERTDPRFQRLRWLRDRARNVAYGLSSRIVVQTETVRRCFPTRLLGRIAVIPGAILPAPRLARPDAIAAPGPRWRIIAVGRLDPQKGLDLLIKAFARVAPAFPDWEVVIFGAGSGAHARSLAALAAAAGLEDRVLFEGLRKNISDELSRSHIMAFPSRFEGFPNALGEGIAHGLPVVAFAGVSGVEELIRPAVNGLLVEQGRRPVERLARALATLMADAALRKRLGAGGSPLIERFRPEIVNGAWAEVLEVAVASARSLARTA